MLTLYLILYASILELMSYEFDAYTILYASILELPESNYWSVNIKYSSCEWGMLSSQIVGNNNKKFAAILIPSVLVNENIILFNKNHS